MREPDWSAAYAKCPWMRLAHQYDGLSELNDRGELHPTVRLFFVHTRFPRSQITKRTSWCAAFACTVLARAGLEHPNSAKAYDFLDSPHFVRLRAPVLGALLVFDRTPDNDRDQAGHVAFCDSERLSPLLDVACLGGNQGNAVCTRRRTLEHLLAALWPRGQPLPPGAVLA